MIQPDDDGVRDLGSPFRMFSPNDLGSMYDVDFHPMVVRADEVHPSEVADPKAMDEVDPSSAPESAPDSSTQVTSTSSESPDSPAPAEKESQVPGLEDLDLPSETSPGDVTPPVAIPPSPPAKTPSSRSAAKSA